MRNLKNNKATGTDGIYPELIKYGGNEPLNRIYELVRKIWDEERIPEEWKETMIVPIHKKGDRDRCENYRGIVLGNAAYKIFDEYNFGKKLNHILKNVPGTIRMDSEMEEL